MRNTKGVFMKITYRIEQVAVDDILVIITAPEHLAYIKTQIHTPHFLLSELQKNINKNLTQSIRRFCKKHKQYADILHNESFEFVPDEKDRYKLHENSCWFYTGRFIDDAQSKLSASERNRVHYENHRRYINQSAPLFYLKVNRFGTNTPIVFQDSKRPVDANELTKYFGIPASEIKYWGRLQRDMCPTGGNKARSVYFPRYEKIRGHNVYPIREVNKYFKYLFENNKGRYDILVQNLRSGRNSAFDKKRL